MPVFKITMTQTLTAEFYVEADSAEEAEELASDVPSEAYKEFIDDNEFQATEAQPDDYKYESVHKPKEHNY